VAFDALGMVAATARRGRPGDPRGSTVDGLDPDPHTATIAAYLADPLGAAPALLGNASTRIVYDLFAYARTRADAQPRPPVAATLARESYGSDLGPGQATRIQLALAYSDGFGRELQNKALVASGPLQPGGAVVDPRWVASGWTVVNNKGLPVRQYEPFFTATHQFEAAVRVGVSPIVCYDPAGRAVATVNPDHTWAKVSFDAWRQQSWDACDTVLIADPHTDADVGDHLARLPASDTLPTWYAARAGADLGPDEQAAARSSAAHAATPAQAYLDPMGRTVLTVAHNRTDDDLLQPTLVALDVEGDQREVVDALGRTVMRYDPDLTGRVLHCASPDAGERWLLGDVAGQPRYAWDSRGFRHRTEYDALRRPVGTYLDDDGGDGGGGGETLVGRTEYGESLDRASAVAGYLLGRVYRVSDGAGTLTTRAYDFAGNPVAVSRVLAADPTTDPDWSREVPLEPVGYVTATAYDALDRPVENTAPDGSRVRPAYDEAGLLARVDVALAGAGDWQPYVTGIAYSAKGQRERISYGNGAVTDHGYDPLTRRLRSLRTVRGADVLQDLAYTYDAVGNVVRIADAAQQTVFFRNTVVRAGADYTYDATYRLVAATGREHLGQAGGPVPPDPYDTGAVGLDAPGDGQAMGRYTQTYGYDPVGNILAVRHTGSDAAHPGWTRAYTYGTGNRLDATTVGAWPAETYTYDAHGSMTTMPHLPLMVWDHTDRLRATSRQVVGEGLPETTWYGYDGGGQRARWVTLRPAVPGQRPTRRCERIYVGGFEVYREYDGAGSTVTLERTSLSIMDDERRVALVEIRTIGDDGSAEILIRYQLGNHLGSSTVELDGAGRLLSYEEYHPYGATSYQAVNRAVRAAAKRYRYTGRERDEQSGFTNHGTRYYAPWLGRWTTVDPIGIAGGLNLYRYAANRPTVATDPTGLAPVEVRMPGIYGHHYVPYSVFSNQGLPQDVYDFFSGAASGYYSAYHASQGSHNLYTGAVRTLWDNYLTSRGMQARNMTMPQAEELLEEVMTQPSTTTIGDFLDQLHAESATVGRPIGNPNVANAAAVPGTTAVRKIAANNNLTTRAVGSAATTNTRTFDTTGQLVTSGDVNTLPSLLQEIEAAGKVSAQRQAAARLAAYGSKGVKALASDTTLLNVEVGVSDYVFADERQRQHQIMVATIGRQDVPQADATFMYDQFGEYPVRDENGFVQGWAFDRTTTRGWVEMVKGIVRVLGADTSDAVTYQEIYPPGGA
jgi:RHS repeat-associated protein